MSFGFGSGSGFGSNNNTTGGFGGFGSNNTSSGTGFGANNTNTTGAFGSTNNTGSGLFGSGTTNTGFGSGTTAFGSSNNNSTAFGAKPGGFGSTSTAGGGLFGSSNSATPATTSNTGFGGFGANNTNNSTSAFGSGSNSLFGSSTANKPAFGGSTATTGGLFGSNNTNTTSAGASFGGFGASANNPSSTALGAVGDPPGTGNIQTFTPVVEKDSATSTAQNSFQNILFQDPYKKWSAEELRLADYAAGRRYGGAGGSSTFGAGTNFGGFGANTQPTSAGFGNTTTNTTGGLFGSSNNNTSAGGAFGQNNQSSGFGSNTTSGGGLFGAKPATGGLFGSGTATTQPAASGGLFGTSGTSSGFGNNNATSGFGSSNTTGGGGLFGNANNNSTANKPAFGGFGTGTTNTAGGFGSSTNTGFGSNNNTGGGGLFGANTTSTPQTGGGLFGNNNTQQTTGAFGSSAFGQQQSQQTGSGLFGNSQAQKPAGGLFGSTGGTNTGTGGGLFGSGTGAFGGQQNQPASGGLFGNANKPAGSTGGLFGNTNTAQNTSGGLFGSGQNNQQQQQQPQQAGGLFGQSQQKPGGLFGTSTGSTGGMFGSQTQQNSMFGSSQQQPQNSTMGSSLFGGSQSTQSNAPSLTASINDPSAYGSLFANLGSNEAASPGPLATPTNRRSSRRPSILPYYKLNPASASRFVTPQKRGYGFSYSTYGTPNSPSSVASTPGTMSQSLLGGSLSRNLGKSVSTSNLRRSFNVEDSVLVPGAFSASSGPRGYHNGSVKKLVINRELRSDLFSTPTKDKPTPETPNTARKLSKRVSFDTSNVEAIENGNGSNGSVTSTPNAEQLGYMRPKSTNGTNGTETQSSSTPEVEQVKGNELAIVHEDEPAAPAVQSPAAPRDSEMGDYWMTPTKEEILNMNRIQRQRVADFTVGRENIGYVKFKIPVDLTSIDLDNLFNKIVVLEPRSATVYPNAAKKPPMGKGLNVPSIINLENAYPRASRTGKMISINKHIERLKKIPDTKFENYNPQTGEWTFSVEHFTTYGLDDSEDEDEDAEPESVKNPVRRADSASPNPSDQRDSPEPRFRSSVPGAFDVERESDNEELEMAEASAKPSFLANRSVGSASQALNRKDEGDMDDEYAMSEVNDDASDHPGHHLAAEHDEGSYDGSQSDFVPETPAGIMRARMRAIKSSATPSKVQVAAGDDWMDMLGKTISPQKRDRALLRSIHEADKHRFMQDSVREAAPAKKRIVSDGKGFATSIDLMNSLFEKAKVPAENLQASIRPQGVKFPYKRLTKNLDESNMDSKERAWHDTMRPTWGPSGTLIFCATPTASAFGRSGRITEKNGLMTVMKGGIVTETQDIRIAKFANEMSAQAIEAHSKLTEVHVVDGIPTVELSSRSSLKDFFIGTGPKNSAAEHERLVWDLASVLFDNIKVPAELQDDPEATEKLRRDNLSRFWEVMVEERTNQAIAMAGTPEEKAVAALSGHRIAEACKHLLDGKNFRLATLIALIGANDDAKKDVKQQLKDWQKSNLISEFTLPIRALYEMLSGNVCACEGRKADRDLEHRAESFVISQKFGLNWQQAFGLRLWYAISSHSNIAEAVNKYWDDVQQDKELHPQVWFAQHGIPSIWNDPRKERREDLLWGLLKLYSDDKADLESILRPENSQLSPLDYRLCWQLGQILTSTGRITFGKNAQEKSDAATTAFAAQLTNEGSWIQAIFVLLHLSNPDSRSRAIQDHLCRHASLIGNDDSTAFRRLAGDFKIPSSWIWHAKALYMRSAKKDATAEVQCLLRAESWAEAHSTFVKEVAPTTIIERDYDALADILQQFEGRHAHVPDWNVGGAIYKAFLQLMGCRRRSEEPPQPLVNSLLEGLPAMHGNTPEAGIIEFAALTDMAAEVAKAVTAMANLGQSEHDRIMQLPLTEDVLLKHSKDLAWNHYSAVMAGH
ncbi:nuclear protein 96-domain-containing protein [Xylariaceae sp. FL1272]|nr:nuclear protein 96-domain-containing protein [Xylariaceae sp. FL1272]